MEHEILVCKCENVEHQVVFTYDSEDKEDRIVYMSVHLIPETNILKRIWVAIKYVFGYRSMYGHFDEFIFNTKDSHKLEKVLRYLSSDIV